MLFTSFSFIVFFVIVFALYWALPHRFRWILLLSASLVFYGYAGSVYLLVLVSAVLLNYFFGIWIEKKTEDTAKSKILWYGILLNLIILAGFKYFNAASEFLAREFHLSSFNPYLFSIVMPLGLSFYTFTNISYLVEVKRGRIPAEKHLGYFSVYVTFFPKLIMGPIERPQLFLPQVREEKVFDYNQATDGLRLILWGLFKKLVLADRLALAVNAVYNDPHHYKGPSIVIVTIFYAFQIYFDFSGYIDIARGISKLLGFNLSKNFNQPYLASSVKDFWSRWHMTLSSWLRDYIFLPFAFRLSRVLKKDHYLGIRTDHIIYVTAITVTFVICGIWHGVGWTFFIWGSLFATYLSVAQITEKLKRKFWKKTGIFEMKWLYSSFQVLITFLLVCFAWIFFRANDLKSAFEILRQSFYNWHIFSADYHTIKAILKFPGIYLRDIASLAVFIPFMILVEYYFTKTSLKTKFISMPRIVRWTIYYLLILAILIFQVEETTQFVYFQF